MEGKNPLFETINALFMNKQYIWSLTPEFINQNIFMVNRRIAIQYPVQASVFNIPKINNKELLYFWSDFFYNGKNVPNWVYTKGTPKKDQDISVEEKISDTLIKKYTQHYHISLKDVKAALRFDHDNAVAELKDFEKLLKLKENGKAYNEGDSE